MTPDCGVYSLAVKFISEVGFPIVVAGWFMFRSDKRQEKVIDLMHKVLEDDSKQSKSED